jgi:hypothetical protein
MKKVPCDPLNTSPATSYQYLGSSGNYCLRACLENANDADISNGSSCGGLNNCAGSPSPNFTVENP